MTKAAGKVFRERSGNFIHRMDCAHILKTAKQLKYNKNNFHQGWHELRNVLLCEKYSPAAPPDREPKPWQAISPARIVPQAIRAILFSEPAPGKRRFSCRQVVEIPEGDAK
jgi:hypothetical protein